MGQSSIGHRARSKMSATDNERGRERERCERRGRLGRSVHCVSVHTAVCHDITNNYDDDTVDENNSNISEKWTTVTVTIITFASRGHLSMLQTFSEENN